MKRWSIVVGLCEWQHVVVGISRTWNTSTNSFLLFCFGGIQYSCLPGAQALPSDVKF